MATTTLRALPNPFSFLDHEGIPAGTFPLDSVQARGDRRWVGATVDRSTGADGKPLTRPLPQPGDRTVFVAGPTDRTGKPTKRRAYVDRAPMKRIRWAHTVDTPAAIEDTPHHRLGFREGSLLAADAATATALGVHFVAPQVALTAAAAAAVQTWTAAHGAPPDTSGWPANLKVFLPGATAPSTAPDPTAPPQAVAAILATIPTAAAAATAEGKTNFPLMTWSAADPGAVALHAALVVALHAAGLRKVMETTTAVSGAPATHTLVLDCGDVAAAAAAAAAVAAATVPPWLQATASTPPAPAVSTPATPAAAGGALS